jgi:hypothetical protein
MVTLPPQKTKPGQRCYVLPGPSLSLMARSNVDRFTDRLLLRRLSRSFGRSSSGIGRSSGGISRGSSSGIRRGSGGVRGGSGGIRRSSGGIRRGSGGFRGSGFRSGFLLAAGRHHRKGRNRGGESNVQFHVGVPQSFLVEKRPNKRLFAAIESRRGILSICGII